MPAAADPIRIAAFHTELSREGPGLLLRDLLEDAEDALAVARVIAAARPDVLLLSGVDYDADGHALAALAGMIAAGGHVLPYRFAWAPNRGIATGADLDGDGRTGTADDAQGHATFAGEGGMALLSAFPVDGGASVDLTGMLWRDLPGALLGERLPPLGAHPLQRLSTTGHWDLALGLPDGRPFRLWAWHATPPVFDGPEDRNGRRNHDEAAVWLRRLEETPRAPVIVMGFANLDPVDGNGRPDALRALLSHARLQDPLPRSEGGRAAAARDGGANIRQSGDPGLDTVDWPDGPGLPGNLRVTYVLPSREWEVAGSGVWWPADGSADAASRHRLVWVDVELR